MWLPSCVGIRHLSSTDGGGKAHRHLQGASFWLLRPVVGKKPSTPNDGRRRGGRAVQLELALSLPRDHRSVRSPATWCAPAC